MRLAVLTGLCYVLDNSVAAGLMGDVGLVFWPPYNEADYEVADSDPHSLLLRPADSSLGWYRNIFKYKANCEECVFVASPTSTCLCVCLTLLRARVRGFIYRIFCTGNVDTRVWMEQWNRREKQHEGSIEDGFVVSTDKHEKYMDFCG
jgi:hypothetical protein